jgi:hypothetical protein
VTLEARDNEAQTRRDERSRDDPTPPSELGDVEDAVAEEVGGDLTEWAPPDQGEGDRDEAASGGARATSRS